VNSKIRTSLFYSLSFVDLSIAVSGFQGSPPASGFVARRGAGTNYTRAGPPRGPESRPPRLPHNSGARRENAPSWSATSCSPTDSLRSTIGARGLNFWVRNGTRCASPAMVADQLGAFFGSGAGSAVPWGPHSATRRTSQEDRSDPEPRIVGRRARPISTARLSASRRLHLQPINLVVYEGSYRKENSSRDGLPA
jgi:hypothetical protein